MTDQPKPAEAGTGAEAKQHSAEETQALIKQLREEAKANRLEAEALKARLAEQQRAVEKAEQDRLAEQGRFKDLYEKANSELTTTKTSLEQKTGYEAAFKAYLETRIKLIPEGMRSLVPEGMEPIALSAWLDKNAALLTQRPAPDLNPGTQGNVGSGGKQRALTAEELDIARRANMTAEQYLAAEAKSKKAQP